jgi:hypothetical protein
VCNASITEFGDKYERGEGRRGRLVVLPTNSLHQFKHSCCCKQLTGDVREFRTITLNGNPDGETKYSCPGAGAQSFRINVLLITGGKANTGPRMKTAATQRLNASLLGCILNFLTSATES